MAAADDVLVHLLHLGRLENPAKRRHSLVGARAEDDGQELLVLLGAEVAQVGNDIRAQGRKTVAHPTVVVVE